ncbi:ESX secretion-associated protein EspG [Hoyosella sp. YIM 151337]|uniref:ESX secretion-associated protein EspG n=1 Tax=Hoyosella sp. YIM 151337 TaxID=2992742 RepID=UPI0022363613|nr:ESX secretion-associated protein EspG [Hoyosella sp. YIM 151337]MCW4354389.1 ESX secretion-associated protein EspG [Hoyosella sp. YIM 151337]
MTWTFTGAEFSVLMHSVGRERLPYPLQYVAPEMMPADRDAMFARARQVVQQTLCHDFEEAVACLVAPQLQIQSVTFVSVGGRVRKLRALAALRGSRAIVVVQQPGESEQSGGDITLRRIAHNDIPAQVARTLPASEPGRTRGVVGTVAEAAALPQQRGARAFFAKERCATGEITATTGVDRGARALTTDRGFCWIDVVGDGRYLVRSELGKRRIEAFPADSGRIEDEVRELLRIGKTQ